MSEPEDDRSDTVSMSTLSTLLLLVVDGWLAGYGCGVWLPIDGLPG